MSKFNTDEIREELASDVWGARELQSQLRNALNEIDRLEEEQGKVRSELEKWHVGQIEQRTKDACKEACRQKVEKQSSPDGLYLYEIEQAVDSVGEKS